MITSGLTKLLELMIEMWDAFIPVFVVDSYEEAVVLRLGGGKLRSPKGRPYSRAVGPTDGLFRTGLHLKWPLAERVISMNVVPAIDSYPNQCFRSKDGTTYLTAVHILWRVEDPVVFTLDIESASDVLSDAAAGITRRLIAQMTDEELQEERFEAELTTRTRNRTKRFGVYIEQTYVSELAPTGLRHGVMRIQGGEAG